MAKVKAQIIATLGPSTSTEGTLRKMFLSGLDYVRLNFSHGSHSDHLDRVEIVRNLNTKMKRAIKIMQDLAGYRIRIGPLKRPVLVKKRERLFFTQEDIVRDDAQIPFDYKGSLRKITAGTLLYVDDGKLVFEIEDIEDKRLKVKPLVNGLLSSRKGINIPGADLDFEALTQKDRTDLQLAIENKFDAVAQSFVRNAGDVKAVKELIKPYHEKCQIFAKIESTQAIKNLDEIIDEADGLIVARGDLGICVPIQNIPILQKEIIRKSRDKNKPVIVATQMLDSMTEEIIPTRAEVSDVANAIFDGATGLMLSAETAIGNHPALVVDMMNKIIKATEEYKSLNA
jgi:pyruvate kinase